VRRNLACTSPYKFHSNDGTVLSYAEDKNFSPNGLLFNNLTFLKDSSVYDFQIIDSTCFVANKLSLDSGVIQKGWTQQYMLLEMFYCNTPFGQGINGHDAVISLTGVNKQNLFSDGGLFPHLMWKDDFQSCESSWNNRPVC
jgi:hypothetical protein